MMRLLRRLLFQLVFVAALAGIVVFAALAPVVSDRSAAGGKRGPRGDAPPNVLAAVARLADVPVYIDGVGTAKALNSVTLRPQVDGQLIKISFQEGQDVKRGDVLALIDPTTYQAQLDQAMAKKGQDMAQLENARHDLERYNRLAQTSAGTAQQADTQRATVAQFEAQVKSDQASIDNAKAILAYTRITSPIDGKTGIRTVDEGNLVRASDAAGIVTITQVQPIAVLFNVPQQQLARINSAKALGPVEVAALGPDGVSVIDTGILQVVDNQVDQATGTVKLKAELPNAGLKIWPGAFLNMRLLASTLAQVVVVPGGAVQRGPKGPFVYVVSDDKVSARVITLSLQDDVQAVVATGLSAGERVVTSGFGQLSDGAKVAAVDATPAALPAAPVAATAAVPVPAAAAQPGLPAAAPALAEPATRPRREGGQGSGGQGRSRDGTGRGQRGQGAAPSASVPPPAASPPT